MLYHLLICNETMRSELCGEGCAAPAKEHIDRDAAPDGLTNCIQSAPGRAKEEGNEARAGRNKTLIAA
jgi:hypothetical protein